MQNFRNLKVWQKAHELVIDIYKHTKFFPPDERYGMRSMLRRTATEIPSSIAFGAGKRTDAEFAQALSGALGHSSRLEYHLLLSRDLEMLTEADYNLLNERLIEVKKMINGIGGRLV